MAKKSTQASSRSTYSKGTGGAMPMKETDEMTKTMRPMPGMMKRMHQEKGKK